MGFPPYIIEECAALTFALIIAGSGEDGKGLFTVYHGRAAPKESCYMDKRLDRDASIRYLSDITLNEAVLIC